MDIIERSIVRAVEEAADGDRRYRVTLEDPKDASRWLQISYDTFNMYYPVSEHPLERIQSLNLELPDLVEVEDWKPREFVTFSHGAHSSIVLAEFLEEFMRHTLSVSDFTDWKVEQ